MYRRGTIQKLPTIEEEDVGGLLAVTKQKSQMYSQKANDEPPLMFMFKSGDDLRQDNLVL